MWTIREGQSLFPHRLSTKTDFGFVDQAVAYLYQFSQYQIEAVHFAIVLRYYGLLRIPKAVSASEGNIRESFTSPFPPHSSLSLLARRTDLRDVVVIVDPTTALPSLNFSRLLHRYTRAFVLTDPTEALNYIYLICLNATTPTSESTTSGRAGKGKEGSSTEGMENQVGICHDYIREVVMDTRRYTDLLGDVRNDGTKIVSLPLPLLLPPNELELILYVDNDSQECWSKIYD